MSTCSRDGKVYPDGTVGRCDQEDGHDTPCGVACDPSDIEGWIQVGDLTHERLGQLLGDVGLTTGAGPCRDA